MRWMTEKKTPADCRRIVHCLFCGVVLFLILFRKMGRTYSERAYHYNLVPLKEIMRFIRYRKVLGTYAVVLNLVGNIIAFMPFGTFFANLL